MVFIQKMCSVSKLGETLNEVEKEGFIVDRYEQAYETTEEPVWFVIGYKDPEEEGQ